jgi:Transposase IS66 family
LLAPLVDIPLPAGRVPSLPPEELRRRQSAAIVALVLDALSRLTPSHSAGKKLQDAIRGRRRHLFVFLANRALPLINNGSEQALRPCVVFHYCHKVTNCFRSEWGAELYADIRSGSIEMRPQVRHRHTRRHQLNLKGWPLPETAATLSPVPRPSG